MVKQNRFSVTMQSHLGCKDLDTVMKIVSLALIALASLYTIVQIVNTEEVEGRFMFYIIVLLSSVLSVKSSLIYSSQD